jgi:hypothetical protein
MAPGECARLASICRFLGVPDWPRYDHLDWSGPLYQRHNGMQPRFLGQDYAGLTPNTSSWETAFLHRRVSMIDLLKNWFVFLLRQLGGDALRHGRHHRLYVALTATA